MHEAQAKEFLDFLASMYGREFAHQAAQRAVSQATQRRSGGCSHRLLDLAA